MRVSFEQERLRYGEKVPKIGFVSSLCRGRWHIETNLTMRIAEQKKR